MKLPKSKIKIAPSLLSCDFSRLAEEIRAVEDAGADLLHVDVMDGHFVPNLTVGPVVVKDIRKVTRLPLDVHLMIEDPVKFADAFVAAGSDMITVHIETISVEKFKRLQKRLAAKGVGLGVSLNPPTPFAKIKRFLPFAQFILVMSVNPGFSGQDFIPAVIAKIRALRSSFSGDIAVDGGINDTTGKLVAEAGATILVAGSYIFQSNDYHETIRRLKWGR